MNNISRESFDPKKNYEKLLFSQQRAVIDFELNELQDRLSYNQYLSNRVNFGDGPVGDAFLVEPVVGENKISVRPGSLIHKGKIISLHESYSVELSVPASNREDIVYLEWWLEEVDSDSDPDLKLTPSTPETATRLKIFIQVNVAEGGTIGSLSSGHSSFVLAMLSRESGDTEVSPSDVTDLRLKTSSTYIEKGGFVINLGSGSFRIEPTSGKINGQDFSLSNLNETLVDDLVYFIYVDSDTNDWAITNSEPTSVSAMVAKVQKDIDGNVVVLEDLRLFCPTASSGGGARSQEGGRISIDLLSASSIPAFSPVAVDSDGRAVPANSAISSRVPVVGVSLNQVSSGEFVRVVVLGTITNRDWSLTQSSNVYLNGTSVSSDAPTTEGEFLQKLGYALSDTSLLVSPELQAEVITSVPSEKALASHFSSIGVIPEGRVVALTDTQRVVKLATSEDVNSHHPIGVTKGPLLGSSGGPVVTFGEITNSSWNWTVGSPVYLSSSEGNLVQKPINQPLTKGVASPIRLERRIISGIPSDTDFIIPSTWSGRNELVFEDGLVRVRDTDYLRITVGSTGIIRFNYSVNSDVEVNAVFSLEDGGLSLAYTLESASLVDPRIFQVPPGAGKNQLVWINGIALRYGAQYTRTDDIITLKPDVVVAPDRPVVAAFSTVENAMMDIVRLPGPFLDPLVAESEERWIAILPEVSGRSYLLFVDGILLEPGDYIDPEEEPRDYLSNPDQRVITLNITIDPNDPPILSIAYSSEQFIESGTVLYGYSSVPEKADCINVDGSNQGTKFILPLGANSNVIPYVDGLAKELGASADPYAGDFHIDTINYTDSISLYQVTFNYAVDADSVALSYGVRGGGMSSPSGTDVQNLAQALFSFSDGSTIPESSWVWLNGRAQELGVDYEILAATKQIHFLKEISESETYSVRVSFPLNDEKMTNLESVLPSSSDNKSYFLPARLNTGKATTVSLDGLTLTFGKDYYRSSNSAYFTVKDGLVSPNFAEISEQPIAVWQLDDNANSTVVAELSGTHDGQTIDNTSDISNTSGLVNRSFTVNGNPDSGILVESLSGVDLSTFSIWFKPNVAVTSSSSETVLLYDNNVSFLSLGSAVGSLSGEIISLKNTSNGKATAVLAEGDNVSTLAAGVWHHILLRYNSTEYEIWVNGVKQETTASPSGNVPLISLSSSVRFASSTLDKAVDGKVDEIALWSSSVSTADVVKLYNNRNGVHFFSPVSDEVILRRPDLYTTKPSVALIRGDGTYSTINVLNRSGYVDVVQDPADLAADFAYLSAQNYDVYVFDYSSSALSESNSDLAYDLWQAGHHVITLSRFTTDDTYPVTAISTVVGSLDSEPASFHVITDDLRDVVDIGGGISGGNTVTAYRSGFIPVYRLVSNTSKITGLIGESPSGGIWLHDCTGGLGRNSTGMHLLLNAITYMYGRDLLRLPVLAATSLENTLSGVTQLYNYKVGYALAPDTLFVNMEPEFSSMVSFGGMADFVALTSIEGSNNQFFALPAGAGFSEIIAVDGIIQRPQLDYVREADVVKFVSEQTGVVSASVSVGGKGMSTPQVLVNNSGTYLLPAYIDSSKKVWIIYDGFILVENVHYVITELQVSLLGGLSSPTVMMFSYSLTEEDMSEFEILPQTTDPLVYNLPANAGDHLVVTKGLVAKKVLLLGVDYDKSAGNTSIVLTTLPSPAESVAVSYSRRAIQQLLPVPDPTSSNADSYWRDPVELEENLPSTGNDIGDVRLVFSDKSLYTYTGSDWVKLYGDGIEISGLTVTSGLLVGDSADILGNLTISGDLVVSGSVFADIGSSLDLNAPLSLGSTLNVSGDTVLESTLQVSGSATFFSGVSISGSTTVSGLNVLGDVDIVGNTTITGNLSVSGTLSSTTIDDITSDVSANTLRLDSIDVILETESTTIFSDNSLVYADARPGIQDPDYREGWYFKNAGPVGSSQNKINWYFDGSPTPITLSDFSAYAIITFDSIVSVPHLAVYTVPQGAGDAAFWYRSKVVYLPDAGYVAGVKYLMYFGEDPQIRPDLPRLTMSVSQAAGPQAGSEIVQFASIGSDSATAIGNCEFVAEAIGSFSTSFKRTTYLRIKKAALTDLDTRQTLSFLLTDALTSGTKKSAVQVPISFIPEKVIIRSDSAADLDIIIDINKVDSSGTSTSLFTQLPGNDKRPVLPAGDIYAEITDCFSGSTVSDSCVLILDLDQIGTSGNEGGNFLYLTIVGTRV